MIPLKEIQERILAKESIYNDIIAKAHKVDEGMAKRVLTAELENYLSRAHEYSTEKPNANLTIAQGVNIFLEVMQSGLSLSKSQGHIYLSQLKGTGSNIGYQITADGLIYKAQKAGAIDHLTEPTLVQNGEQFAIRSTEDGRQIVEHTILFEEKEPITFDNLMLGYIYIVYPNGNRELSWISKNRLAQYREKSLNKGMYNDESFLQTKVIKHALRKVRKSDFMTQMQNEEDEIIAENMEWEATPEVIDTENTITNEPF